MMVADSIPVNSDVSPLITKFLIICMVMISSALVCNLLSMNVMGGTTPVPGWLYKFAIVYIGPFVGFCSVENSKSLDEIAKYLCPIHHIFPSKNHLQATTFASHRNKCYSTREPNISQHINWEKSSTLNKTNHHEAKENMKAILNRSEKESTEVFTKDFWRCMAETMDRICMILFSTSFFFVSMIVLLKGYDHQRELQQTDP